jgi:hypothetical protein
MSNETIVQISDGEKVQLEMMLSTVPHGTSINFGATYKLKAKPHGERHENKTVIR